MTTLAIITARGNSKGVPLKNIKPLNGIPLINYTIKAALSSTCINDLLVSTDHQGIAEISREAGAKVPFMRPAKLATDDAKSIDVVVHAIDYYEKERGCRVEHVILLQPTSPLRTAEDIDKAWHTYLELEADSLQSVVETTDHPYYLRDIKDGFLMKIDKNDNRENLRRQDLEKVYRVNGAIYIANRELVMSQKTLTGEMNAAFIMDKTRSIDIDDILDFKLAELVLTGNMC